MMPRSHVAQVERLLTVGEVAELLGTTERFPRRLIAERRIRFARVGRHIRIPESAVSEFIEAGLVEPCEPPSRGRVPDGPQAEVRESTAASIRPLPGPLPGTGWQGPACVRHFREQDGR